MAQPGFPEILAFGDTGYGDELLRGTFLTLQISVLAYSIGLLIGLAGAMGKLGGGPLTRAVLNFYTTFVRAAPELILILLIYYAGTSALNSLLASYGFKTVAVSGFMAAVARPRLHAGRLFDGSAPGRHSGYSRGPDRGRQGVRDVALATFLPHHCAGHDAARHSRIGESVAHRHQETPR